MHIANDSCTKLEKHLFVNITGGGNFTHLCCKIFQKRQQVQQVTFFLTNDETSKLQKLNGKNKMQTVRCETN